MMTCRKQKTIYNESQLFEWPVLLASYPSVNTKTCTTTTLYQFLVVAIFRSSTPRLKAKTQLAVLLREIR